MSSEAVESVYTRARSVYFKEFLVSVDVHDVDWTAEDVMDALAKEGMKASCQLLRYVKSNTSRSIHRE